LDIIKVIETIENDVKSAKDQGNSSIDVDKILGYLEQLKGSSPIQIEVQKDLARYAHERSMEQYKANINTNLANYNALMQQGRELTKVTIDIGQAAVKSVIFINGASAVALLTLIGNLWVRNDEAVVTAIGILITGVGNFAEGTLLGALSAGASYFCQGFYTLNYEEIIKQKFQEQPDNLSIMEGKRAYRIAGKLLHAIAVIACIAAYIYFGNGIYSLNEAFRLQFK